MEIERERQVCFLMIELYCRKTHRQQTLCPQCRELQDYVSRRLEHCPYGDLKEFCSACTTHCYRPDMRERIRSVMRFSGPRMLLHHPLVAFRHLLQTIRSKARKERLFS